MNHTEKYSDRELTDMKERCLYMITSFTSSRESCNSGWSYIYQIALIEINRELDARKILRLVETEDEQLACKILKGE